MTSSSHASKARMGRHKRRAKKNANSEKGIKVRTSLALGSPEVANLRIFFEIKCPVRVIRGGSSGSRFELDLKKLQKSLPFFDHANTQLTRKYVYQPKPTCPKNTRATQAKLFRKLLDSGTIKSRAELARKFGVSRAWVTKVLK